MKRSTVAANREVNATSVPSACTLVAVVTSAIVRLRDFQPLEIAQSWMPSLNHPYQVAQRTANEVLTIEMRLSIETHSSMRELSSAKHLARMSS